MQFFYEDPRRKPEKWGPVTPGFVAPEWRWAWRDLVGAWPLWNAGGPPPRDIVNGVPSTYASTEPTSTVTPHGIGLEMVGGNTNEGIELDGSLRLINHIPINVAGTEGTVIALFNTNNTNEGQVVFGGRDTASGESWQVLIATSGFMAMTLFGVAGYVVTIPAAHKNSDYKVWGWSFRINDIFRAFINGIQIGSDLSIGIGKVASTTQPHGLFSQWDGADSRIEGALNGKAVSLYLWNRFLSDEEHRRIALDPFGLLRMADVAPFVTPAVAGSIPLFYHHYRQMWGH